MVTREKAKEQLTEWVKSIKKLLAEDEEREKW